MLCVWLKTPGPDRLRAEQQPGNRLGTRTIVTRLHCIDYFTAIHRFPSWPYIVCTESSRKKVEAMAMARDSKTPFLHNPRGEMGQHLAYCGALWVVRTGHTTRSVGEPHVSVAVAIADVEEAHDNVAEG